MWQVYTRPTSASDFFFHFQFWAPADVVLAISVSLVSLNPKLCHVVVVNFQKNIGIYKMFKAPLILMVLLICQLKIRVVGISVCVYGVRFLSTQGTVRIRFLGIEGYGAEE
jgi:hypothetical protein